MSGMLFVAAMLLLALALGLLLWGWRQRQQSGVPEGKIIYSDTGAWRRNDRPLFSNRYRLTGKPDYLVRQGGEIIPVEVKSTQLRGRRPYASHVMQLAAYCLLVEDVLGVRPSHGILKYADVTLRIDYDEALRQALLATIQAMRRASGRRDIPRNHNDAIRCRYCGYRGACDQALES
jgi:CRISPR-associated exonuclease Cas4